MLPVLTPAAMAEVDRAASASMDTLIGRAGWAVARSAVELLGGTYGRRVIAICGKGNNGADGRVAAAVLARRGVRVELRDPDDRRPIAGVDLVIDAAFGTGFRGTYDAPQLASPVRVLAVDIPSGLDGRTGAVAGTPLAADRTVTFAALKPGVLLGDSHRFVGEIELVDLGLDLAAGHRHDGAPVELVETADLVDWVPTRRHNAHKWQSATWIIGGSATMTGAAALAARGAQAAGAGYVRVSCPGIAPSGHPMESVVMDLPASEWASAVFDGLDRVSSVVIGPGLGRSESTQRSIAASLERFSARGVPTVADADALAAIAARRPSLGASVVLTPHDGEFEQLAGQPPGGDRIEAARSLASSTRAVVLLKGPVTVVAAPDGAVRLVNAGDARLATAGTGDVLSGVIGALLAAGHPPFDAAAAGALVHGLAARGCVTVGMVAGDLPAEVSALLSNPVLAPHLALAPTIRRTTVTAP